MTTVAIRLKRTGRRRKMTAHSEPKDRCVAEWSLWQVIAAVAGVLGLGAFVAACSRRASPG